MKRLAIFLIPFVLLGEYKVLFDNSKSETAGNADWIIDDNQPYPSPPQPLTPEDWLGAYSSFGYYLKKLGIDVVTLPPSYTITYGDPQNPLDLSNFDVFIMPEPQDPLSQAEKSALISFVESGGGLFMIANHYASDRNSNGWDSPRIFNNLGSKEYFGIHFNVGGDSDNNFYEAPDSNVSTDPSDPIIYGKLGRVGAIGYYAGTAMTLYPSYNSSVRGHIWRIGEWQGSNERVMLATASYGSGRVAGIGDSSPGDDGTGQPGNNLYNGWDEPDEDNDLALLNVVLWLLRYEENIPPFISRVVNIPSNPSLHDTVVVSARITDDSGLLTTLLHYNVNGAGWLETSEDSVSGNYVYFSIVVDEAGEYACFIEAVDDSGASSFSDTISFVVVSDTVIVLDGWYLHQENSSRSYNLSGYSIPEGGYLIVARNATKNAFENFWGVTLGPEVVYINSGGQFPVINGSEIFALINSDGDTVDGPTISLQTGHSYQRVSPALPAWYSSAWNVTPDYQATPGTGGVAGYSTLYISEFSDASGSGNYIYEFVELHFSSSTDVKEYEQNLKPKILIYPIPAGDFIHVLNFEGEARVYSLNGRLVQKITVWNGKISINGLGEGVYILKVGDEMVPFVKVRGKR